MGLSARQQHHRSPAVLSAGFRGLRQTFVTTMECGVGLPSACYLPRLSRQPNLVQSILAASGSTISQFALLPAFHHAHQSWALGQVTGCMMIRSQIALSQVCNNPIPAGSVARSRQDTGLRPIQDLLLSHDSVR